MWPALGYLDAAGQAARSRGARFVGTEHLLLALVDDDEGDTARALARLGLSAEGVRAEIGHPSSGSGSAIDADALATLGIDLDEVRARLEESFGPGALERTRAGCMPVAPRLKQTLAHAAERAGDGPVEDVHVLLGMLAVEDSAGACLLREAGIGADAVARELGPT